MVTPALLVLLAGGLWAGGPARVSPNVVAEYHSVVPLGMDASELLPAGRPLVLMATALSPEFEGWRRVESEGRQLLLRRDGGSVERYPQALDFHVTLTTRLTSNSDVAFSPVICDHELNQALLDVQFRLKVFRGLSYRILRPRAVRLVGVPADVPYEERIYRVVFDLPHIPVRDRVVLEVVSHDGERLGRFHLDLW